MQHVEKRILRSRYRINYKRGRIDRWGCFQRVVRIGSSGSKAATSHVKCAVFSGICSRVNWAVDYLCLKGWAVSESGLLSRSSPFVSSIKLTSLNGVNLLKNPVKKTELAKIGEEPLRDWSWISQKSPSPFSKPRGTVHGFFNVFRDTSSKIWF